MKYLQEIEQINKGSFSILKYSRGNRIEQLAEFLFQKEDCKATRHEISVNVFKKNLHTMEIDFYKEGLEKRNIITVFTEVNNNGREVEIWQLSQ